MVISWKDHGIVFLWKNNVNLSNIYDIINHAIIIILQKAVETLLIHLKIF